MNVSVCERLYLSFDIPCWCAGRICFFFPLFLLLKSSGLICSPFKQKSSAPTRKKRKGRRGCRCGSRNGNIRSKTCHLSDRALASENPDSCEWRRLVHIDPRMPRGMETSLTRKRTVPGTSQYWTGPSTVFPTAFKPLFALAEERLIIFFFPFLLFPFLSYPFLFIYLFYREFYPKRSTKQKRYP